jgi:hypothetical protein
MKRGAFYASPIIVNAMKLRRIKGTNNVPSTEDRRNA